MPLILTIHLNQGTSSAHNSQPYFLFGFPGLTACTISGSLHISNRFKKSKTISDAIVIFRIFTHCEMSAQENTSTGKVAGKVAGGVALLIGGTGNMRSVLSKKEDWFKEEVVVLSDKIDIAAGGNKDLPFTFTLPAPTTSNQLILPSAFSFTGKRHRCETKYLINANVKAASSSPFSSPKSVQANTRISPYAFNLSLPYIRNHLLDIAPTIAPGWHIGSLIDLPLGTKPQTLPIPISLTFPDGLLLHRGTPFHIAFTSAHNNVKTIEIAIDQHFTFRSIQRAQLGDVPIQDTVKILLATQTFRPTSSSHTFAIQIPDTTDMVATFPIRKGDIKQQPYLAHHQLHIKVEMVDQKEKVKMDVPVVLVDLSRRDVVSVRGLDGWEKVVGEAFAEGDGGEVLPVYEE
ncbi:hypothetical protein HK097_002019 [Rhizophlyctis rosea]|uniref:Uncharacterized protein n=1 Tax=Rhizophlyctis rosea TaxID=64517 RepID=A0AAD5SJ07_9FUNG|nr:hypothetical protein HK097_002019 [Rhizophlyctis rosea]